MDVIELRDLRKSYTTRQRKFEVLRIERLDVREGDFLAIEGPSGCGKSTLLNLMGLLDRPDAGTIRIDEEDVTRAPERVRSGIRNRKVGFVFQQFNLLPELSAVQNVALPLLAAGVPRAHRIERATGLLDRVGLRSARERPPSQLSGGEQQRVAIARALANRPRIVLADEPTGNLDRANTASVMDLLQEVNRDGTTVVVVTHDSGVAARAKRVLHPLVRK